MASLAQKRLFLLDMDGTIYLDHTLFPGTLPFLRRVRSALTLAGLVPSAGLSARPAHAAGGTLRQRGAFHAGCYAQGTLTQRAFRQYCFF